MGLSNLKYFISSIDYIFKLPRMYVLQNIIYRGYIVIIKLQRMI